MNEYWDEIPDQGYIDRLQAENAALLTRLQEVTYTAKNYFERRGVEVDGVFQPTTKKQAHEAVLAAAVWLADKEGE